MDIRSLFIYVGTHDFCGAVVFKENIGYDWINLWFNTLLYCGYIKDFFVFSIANKEFFNGRSEEKFEKKNLNV